MSWLRYLFPPDPSHLAQRLVAGEPPRVVLDGLARSTRSKAVYKALRTLAIDDRSEEEVVLLLALAELDHELVVDRVDVLVDAGRVEEASHVCRGALARRPENVIARRELYRLLRSAGREDEAMAIIFAGPDDPALELSRVDALLYLGRREEAIARLQAVLTFAEARIKHALGSNEWSAYRDLLSEALEMREWLMVETFGREELVRDAARSGKLDRHAGVNYRLLGQAAMAEGDRVAATLDLLHPEDVLDKLGPRRDYEDRDVMVRRVESLLRLGDLPAARRAVLALRESHPAFFPGDLGYGALLTLERTSSLRVVGALPEADIDPGWKTIIPDWDHLSALERRVVSASVAGLDRVRPYLLARGMRIHLLPLDVRPVDHPAFAAAAGVRSDDGRALAGVAGVASTDGVAVARIEDLLDVNGENSWVFAHELAHLAFWCLPHDLREQFQALFADAVQVEWAWTAYQAGDIDEFFACSYQDLLLDKYGTLNRPVSDRAGQWERVKMFLEALR